MSRVTVVYRNTRGIKSEKGFLFLIFSLFIPGPPDGVLLGKKTIISSVVIFSHFIALQSNIPFNQNPRLFNSNRKPVQNMSSNCHRTT